MWPLCQNGELRRVKSWQIHTAPRGTLKFTLTYIHFYLTFEYRYILQSPRVGSLSCPSSLWYPYQQIMTKCGLQMTTVQNPFSTL